MTEAAERIRRAVENSRLAAAGSALATSPVTARIESRGAHLAAVVRNSFLYRWLTKEPDPDVVVIDLRRTRTVGPFVRAIDWFARLVGPHWRLSRLKRGLDRSAALGEDLAQTGPVRRLRRLLEPPPERESNGDSD